MKILQAIKAATYAVKAVFTTTNLHLSMWWRGISADWGGVTYDQMVKRAFANPTSARALRLISQLMAALPFVVELPGEEKTMVNTHEMLRILTRPNARTSTSYLCDQITSHLYCGGELFIRRITPNSGPNAGKPTANGASLTLLNPGLFFDFLRDATDDITGYRFRDRRGRYHDYTLDEVLHVRVYNPQPDTERGLPLLIGASRALDQIAAADEWNRNISSGGGRVPGYFSPRLSDGQQLTPEQVAAAQAQADEATRDRRATHMPQVLSGAFDFKEGGMTLKDADFLKANQQNSRFVAAVCGIAPTLLGDEKAGSLTDAGIDSEVRAAYLLTVLPIVDFVFGEINNWLSPLYGGARLAYDRDQIEALTEDVNKMYQRTAQACGGPFLTVNEAREVHNYEPLQGDAYDQVRRTVETEVGGRVVRDGDADAEAGEGQSDRPPMRLFRQDDDLAGVRAAIRARFESTGAA